MKDSLFTTPIIVLLIIGTAILLFRQGALGVKSLIAVILSVGLIGGYIFLTLMPAG